MTQTIDWAARGISWVSEDVSKQHGDHATDRVVIGKAQIPVVSDLEKFRKEYGDSCILGILDGTSIRVMAQDVNRSGIAKKLSAEEIQSRIDARLRGIRNRSLAAVVKEVTVYLLPNGEKWTATADTAYESDEADYQAQYMAALVDAGVDVAVARMLATQQKLV